jgi:hypothetical protein
MIPGGPGVSSENPIAWKTLDSLEDHSLDLKIHWRTWPDAIGADGLLLGFERVSLADVARVPQDLDAGQQLDITGRAAGRHHADATRYRIRRGTAMNIEELTAMDT